MVLNDLENFMVNLDKKLNTALELLELNNNALTTKKNVAEYLDVSTKTISNYIKNEKLKENIHYIKVEGKIVYVPKEIIKFKQQRYKNVVENEPKKEDYSVSIDDTTKHLLRGINNG